jgi:hypothetical protein
MFRTIPTFRRAGLAGVLRLRSVPKVVFGFESLGLRIRLRRFGFRGARFDETADVRDQLQERLLGAEAGLFEAIALGLDHNATQVARAFERQVKVAEPTTGMSPAEQQLFKFLEADLSAGRSGPERSA